MTGKKLFNGVCDYCANLKPRCAHGLLSQPKEETTPYERPAVLCEDCRRELRQTAGRRFRLDVRHK